MINTWIQHFYIIVVTVQTVSGKIMQLQLPLKRRDKEISSHSHLVHALFTFRY